MKTLSRKERRALEFGTPEQRAEVRAKMEGRKPFYVQEINGKITIPYIKNSESIHGYVLKEVPEEYLGYFLMVENQSGYASTPKGYSTLLEKWFFLGLQQFEPTFKPNVVAELEDESVTSDPLKVSMLFRRYLSFLLNDWELCQGHKIAFTSYVCDVCCEQIFWMEK